jgi:hypothetical protein
LCFSPYLSAIISGILTVSELLSYRENIKKSLEGGIIMLDFIDISLLSSSPEKPYHVLRFRGGAVIEMSRHSSIDSLADYCRRHDLPALTGSLYVRDKLEARGISVKTFETRAIGE